MRNTCPKIDDRWEALKHFHLQRFQQNKLGLSHIVFSQSFFFFPRNSPKILPFVTIIKCLIFLMHCIELLCLSGFFYYFTRIFLEEVCCWHLFHCGLFSWISEMDLSNTIQYYSWELIHFLLAITMCPPGLSEKCTKSGYLFAGNLFFGDLLIYTVVLIDLSFYHLFSKNYFKTPYLTTVWLLMF